MTLEKIIKHLSVDPKVQHGEPCIRGTRTPVYVILEELALGSTPEEIKSEYPPLTDEDIKACLTFAALLAKEEEVPLSKS